MMFGKISPPVLFHPVASHEKIPEKKSLDFHRGFKRDPGNDLLSHPVTRAVPSALRGLTTVFGMGTGVTPSPESPGQAPPSGAELKLNPHINIIAY